MCRAIAHAARAIAALGAGDVLLVTRLDRLARSTRDLLNVLDAVAKAGADFRSLADAWADTTTPHGRLMLTVLGGLAEFERELIKARTTEGRKRAQARGVRFGRKLKLTPHQRQEAIARREAGEALVEIGRSYNVSHSTIRASGRHSCGALEPTEAVLPRQELKRVHEHVASGLELLRDPFRRDPMPNGRAVR
jgi:DNA invertase Pin-like site-specific DNA recombinase